MSRRMLRTFSYLSILSSLALGACKTTRSSGLANTSLATSANCVDQTMEKLGISWDMQSSPELLADILKRDMKVEDLPGMKELLGSKLERPEPLKPMFVEIKKGLMHRHQPFYEFLCTAVEKNLLPPVTEEGRKIIDRTINHMVALDALTKATGESVAFMEALHQHMLKKRAEFGISSGFVESTLEIYKVTGDLFEPAKAKTMDLTYQHYLEIRKQKGFRFENTVKRRAGLVMNITEAMLTDKVSGYDDNALAGLPLALKIFNRASVNTEFHDFVEFEFPAGWDALYETWNAAFITGNLKDLHIIFPKLLIPQVINAEPKRYLLNRSLALWPTINFSLFYKIEKRPEVVLPNAKELAKEWGKINLKYSQAFMRQHENKLLSSFRQILDVPLEEQLKVQLQQAYDRWLAGKTP